MKNTTYFACIGGFLEWIKHFEDQLNQEDIKQINVLLEETEQRYNHASLFEDN